MGTVQTVRLAAIGYQAGFFIDDFLARVAATLRVDGVCVGGAVQAVPAGFGEACGTMTLTDLASGAVADISQQLGTHSKGCRLDPGRLAEFGTRLERIPQRTELLIFNKFGKAEADGHGLRRNLEQAIEANIPVLTAVRPPYDEAWRRFHGGLAADLAPDIDAVRKWCLIAVRERRMTTSRSPSVARPRSPEMQTPEPAPTPVSRQKE